ncbi:MAG TPA: Tol-Pal system protein TolB, partial [Burkholderiales bacterium]|nr:Tol-Pal system protein TolB [Burkholderiales bacterium]
MRLDGLVRLVRAAAFLLLLAPLPLAHAALTIEIVGAGANQFPIAIVPFRAEAGLPQQLTPVIEADLARSGMFKTVDAGGVNPSPSEPQDVNFPTWRARGADAIVIGSVS